MPGTLTFRPIEANLTHNTDLLTKMSPYCSFTLGGQKFTSQICKKGGKHPVWNDVVTVPYTNDQLVTVELMDKDRITKDDVIGGCAINIAELQSKGQSRNWYPLFYKNKPAGEILLESSLSGGLGQQGLGQQGFAQQGFSQQGLGQQGFAQQNLGAGSLNQQSGFIAGQQSASYGQEGILAGGLTNQTGYSQQGNWSQGNSYVDQSTLSTEQHHGRIFTEQHQSVEPHTFMKTVDVVETVPVNKQVEVMEARKVLKDVEYTQAVPVTKTIDIVEPHVVMKEVEVIEPRVVNKVIQVVENVPVKRQVEVIEMEHRTQQVESFEPQTFHKQVEVTEHVPTMRTVQVSEPVHVTKNVEFVEPIITTQTITKEIVPEVIVNQRTTQEVGPATLVGMSQQQYIGQQQFVGQRQWFGQRQFSFLQPEQRTLREQELFNGSYADEERNWRVYELLHGLNKEERRMKKRQFRDRGLNFWSKKQLRSNGYTI